MLAQQTAQLCCSTSGRSAPRIFFFHMRRWPRWRCDHLNGHFLVLHSAYPILLPNSGTAPFSRIVISYISCVSSSQFISGIAHASSVTASYGGRAIAESILSFALVDEATPPSPSSSSEPDFGKTRLKLLRCPLGRSVRLGALGRCLPRARPPTTGISYVAARHRYSRMS